VSGTVYSPNATFNGGTVTITPSGTSHPWIFTYYGTDPCLRSDANNYGVLGSDSYYLWKIYVNTVNASKLYGTVGLPQPLKRPLKGLEDLKMVQFREDGLPVEKSLPTHIVSEVDRVREEIRSRKIAEKANSKENASLNLSEVEEKEIEDEVNKVINSDTVNICHTVGWLIQCIKQLSDKVEELENKIRVLEGNKP
jgi:hypothetical protein